LFLGHKFELEAIKSQSKALPVKYLY